MAEGADNKPDGTDGSPARKTRRRKAQFEWSTIDLKPAPAEYQLLDARKKDDGVDLSKHLVRKRRFRPSYMTATNGGALFEDILRRQVPPSASSRPNKEPGSLAGPFDNVIGIEDTRIEIADTSQVPARSVGLLEIVPEFGPLRYGTAWLIGPRTLATAAHNLVHPQAGRTKSLRVGMAYDGSAALGGWHKVIDNVFETGWSDNMVPGNPRDFAVLKIEDRTIGEQLGWFGFADYEDAKFGDLVVNIFGYPMDLKRHHMYGASGRVKQVDEGRLYYDCDAGPGMSGGPVIARFQNRRIAVGIHVVGGLTSNIGTRLNDLAYRLFDDHRNW